MALRQQNAHMKKNETGPLHHNVHKIRGIWGTQLVKVQLLIGSSHDREIESTLGSRLGMESALFIYFLSLL